MKKSLIIGICLIIGIVLLGIITNYADTARVTTGHEPQFCLKIINANGNKITYWGLGYKVIRYVGVSPNEPYESNIGVKMGNWLMQYELPNDSKYSEQENKVIEDLDDFYNTELTQNQDIRNLGKEYGTSDAQKDNCFVIGATVYNDFLYEEFMQNCQNKKTAFIRVAQNTVEGDLILSDILYDERTNHFYLVTDDTRDEFSANRKIELREFENMAEYEYKTKVYWVLYHGELNDETFNSNDVFVIMTIN